MHFFLKFTIFENFFFLKHSTAVIVEKINKFHLLFSLLLFYFFFLSLKLFHWCNFKSFSFMVKAVAMVDFIKSYSINAMNYRNVNCLLRTHSIICLKLLYYKRKKLGEIFCDIFFFVLSWTIIWDIRCTNNLHYKIYYNNNHWNDDNLEMIIEKFRNDNFTIFYLEIFEKIDKNY